jgi:CheY-like chemotaxis protein
MTHIVDDARHCSRETNRHAHVIGRYRVRATLRASSCRVAERTGHRVLVVDDNADLIDSVEIGLTSLGYDVRSARDGLAALEAAVAFRPHAALIDISLPAISGWDLAERLRAHPVFKRPRLIALTGFSSAAHRAKSAASGFDVHLVKPVSIATLHEVLSAD